MPTFVCVPLYVLSKLLIEFLSPFFPVFLLKKPLLWWDKKGQLLGSAAGVWHHLGAGIKFCNPTFPEHSLSSNRATSCRMFAKEKDHTDKTVKLPGTQHRFYNMHADQKGLTKMGFNHIWALESSQVQKSGLCLVSFWQSSLFFNNPRKTRQTQRSHDDSVALFKPNIPPWGGLSLTILPSDLYVVVNILIWTRLFEHWH